MVLLIKILKPDFEFKDDRGSLIQLVHAGYRQFNIIFSQAGALRGGHFHRQNEEAFYIIDGDLILLAEKDGIRENYHFHKGAMFQIPRNVLHSFQFKANTLLASMYSDGVELSDGTKDIRR